MTHCPIKTPKKGAASSTPRKETKISPASKGKYLLRRLRDINANCRLRPKCKSKKRHTHYYHRYQESARRPAKKWYRTDRRPLRRGRAWVRRTNSHSLATARLARTGLGKSPGRKRTPRTVRISCQHQNNMAAPTSSSTNCSQIFSDPTQAALMSTPASLTSATTPTSMSGWLILHEHSVAYATSPLQPSLAFSATERVSQEPNAFRAPLDHDGNLDDPSSRPQSFPADLLPDEVASNAIISIRASTSRQGNTPATDPYYTFVLQVKMLADSYPVPGPSSSCVNPSLPHVDQERRNFHRDIKKIISNYERESKITAHSSTQTGYCDE